jgi:hypothetical protein
MHSVTQNTALSRFRRMKFTKLSTNIVRDVKELSRRRPYSGQMRGVEIITSTFTQQSGRNPTRGCIKTKVRKDGAEYWASTTNARINKPESWAVNAVEAVISTAAPVVVECDSDEDSDCEDIDEVDTPGSTPILRASTSSQRSINPPSVSGQGPPKRQRQAPPIMCRYLRQLSAADRKYRKGERRKERTNSQKKAWHAKKRLWEASAA